MSFTIDNNVRVTISAPAAAGASSITVSKAVAPNRDPPVPASGAPGILTLVDRVSNPTKIEVVTYSGRVDNGATWTLTGLQRGLEGTTGQSWAANDVAFQSITSGVLGAKANTPALTRITGSTTAVAGTAYLAVVSSATNVTLPAFSSGNSFFVANSRDSTANVTVVVGGANSVNHPAFATGDDVLLAPGEAVHLVAESANELDILSPGAVGPTGPTGPAGPAGPAGPSAQDFLLQAFGVI